MKSEGASNCSNEALKPVEERKVGKRKAMTKADKSVKQKKQRNTKKDPNKPKRPASAFFVFLEEFRKDFKKEHPDVKAVSAVGKAGGQKWKSMSDAEKAKYEAEAAKRKSEYEKLMKAYNKKQESTKDDGDVEPDWSESDMNDEDEEDEANAEFRNLLLVVLCYLASESEVNDEEDEDGADFRDLLFLVLCYVMLPCMFDVACRVNSELK